MRTLDGKEGVVVHLGCRDGTKTAALRLDERFLVHGLDADPANVAKARAHVRSLGLYGPVAVDVFDGANRGLVVAEIELESEDQPFTRPDWLGEEVSHDPRYQNARLCEHPYASWKESG